MKVIPPQLDDDANKICPRCQAQFHCTVKEGCWCEKVTLDQQALKKLRANYIDCLCKNCLNTFQTSKN